MQKKYQQQSTDQDHERSFGERLRKSKYRSGKQHLKKQKFKIEEKLSKSFLFGVFVSKKSTNLALLVNVAGHDADLALIAFFLKGEKNEFEHEKTSRGRDF